MLNRRRVITLFMPSPRGSQSISRCTLQRRLAGGAASGMSSTSHRALGHLAVITFRSCRRGSPLKADAAERGHAATDSAAGRAGPGPACRGGAAFPDAPNGQLQSCADALCGWSAATPARRGPSWHATLSFACKRQDSAPCSCCRCSHRGAGSRQWRGGSSGGGHGAHLSRGDFSPARVLGQRWLRALAATQHRGEQGALR